MITITALWLIIAPSLPSVESLRDVRMQVPLRIYSADDRLISEIGEQRRLPVPIEDIPPVLRDAFLAAEDDRFFRHPGIDWRGTLRGVFGYVRTMGQGRVPGGSTITQQVARRFFLSTEYSVTRKLREIMLAIKIERELTKEQILELYFNKEFLGHRAYGVGAAARIYYGKTVDELTVAETAMIASLPKAPSRINPISGPERAMERRNWVLDRMHSLGYIDEAQWRTARNSPDLARLHGPLRELDAPWIAEMGRQVAMDALGSEDAYTGGYRMTTTVSSELQESADRAVRDGLDAYDRRHGWRGPEDTLDAEVLDDPERISEALEETGTVGDLLPAVVVASNTERAVLRLRDDREITLDLDAISWAREHLGPNALGSRPERVDAVLEPGDLVRVRARPADPAETGDDEEAGRPESTDAGTRWRLAQVPAAQAALVALDPETGAIRALVGGLDFATSQFNRAIQSQRQPGSAFKPFIYAAALDHGYTPASLVNDAPVVFDDPSQERVWRPTNFSRRFYGPTRLREAMVQSRNLVSVRLLMGMGLETTRDYVSGFGFDHSELPSGPSLALGSASITPLQMAAAYAIFANGGYAVEPHVVLAIRDRDGHIVYEPDVPVVCADCPPPRPPRLDREAATVQLDADAGAVLPRVRLDAESGGDDEAGEDVAEEPPEPMGPPVPRFARQVLSPQTTWLIRSMMADVITDGTGRRAMALGRSDLAGKTGTTNDLRDTWFAGFNDALVTTVWLGRDGNETLGDQEQGGRTALPIWVDFMAEALEGVPESTPPIPSGLTQARIDPETGLRARPGNSEAIMEWFHAGNLPPLEDTGDDTDERESEDPYEIF